MNSNSQLSKRLEATTTAFYSYFHTHSQLSAFIPLWETFVDGMDKQKSVDSDPKLKITRKLLFTFQLKLHLYQILNFLILLKINYLFLSTWSKALALKCHVTCLRLSMSKIF